MKISFMKYALLSIAALVCMVSLFSCKEESGPTMEQKQQLTDTIMARFPNVTRVYMNNNPDTSANALYITLGDATMFHLTPDSLSKIANKIGKMAIDIYGKNVSLKNGTLAVTNLPNFSEQFPAGCITAKINIDSLNKTK
jgi:hypothetical protein